MSMWAFGRALTTHKKRIIDLSHRTQHLEAAAAYHGLTPLPWDIEEAFQENQNRKYFKQEGNVVYLPEKE